MMRITIWKLAVVAACLLGLGSSQEDNQRSAAAPHDRSQEQQERRIRARGHRGRNAAPRPRGLVVVQSQDSFDVTYNRLRQGLANNPNIRIINEFDHSANAASVGLTLPPNRLIVFGNPALGSPVMAQRSRAGIDLPQKMLVYEDDGKVFVAYNPTDYLVARYGSRIRRAATLDTISGALRNFANLAATGDTGNNLVGNADRLGRRQQRAIGSVRDFIQSRSNADFETTWARLLDALEKSPASIAFTVDHSANAESVDIDLRNLRVVVFGNPRLGTALMADQPSAGIDLPLKILVWQGRAGRVNVSATRVEFIKFRHGLQVDVSTLSGALQNFVRIAARGA